MSKSEEILEFWFQGFDSPDDFDGKKIYKFFVSDENINAQIRERFFDDIEKARSGEYDSWSETVRGSLALIIILDQFTRNLYPKSSEKYSGDEKARILAKQAVEKGFDEQVWPLHKLFFYLPFEHSENLEDQKFLLQKFDELIERSEDPTKNFYQGLRHYASLHATVIEKYGRFPGRNQIFGRVSTPEEEEYLATDKHKF
jgi:uncharacterized protein (DUF924 family)